MTAELIARLEKATGPSRELGEAVLLASGWHKTCVGHFYGPLYTWHGPNGEYFKDDDFARHDPTRSIDAALTLVSNDHFIEHIGQLPPGWSAKLSDKIDDTKWWDWDGASTSAIALCIAALKAKEGKTDGE